MYVELLLFMLSACYEFQPFVEIQKQYLSQDLHDYSSAGETGARSLAWESYMPLGAGLDLWENILSLVS